MVVEFTIEYRKSTVFFKLGLKFDDPSIAHKSSSGVVSAPVS